jgi:hypothetical protein
MDVTAHITNMTPALPDEVISPYLENRYAPEVLLSHGRS